MRHGIWWRPDRAAWWMGVLFAIGATLFLVPGVASLWSSANWVFATFFAGSIFFTSAATVQLVAAFEVPHRLRTRAGTAHERPLRPRSWMPSHIDWLSAAIQWPGTVLFNINTFEALDHALTVSQQDVRVWTPDMIGSGCFLVSSLLAFANVEHRWLSWRPHDLDWCIGAANLLGSIAFGISAVASFVRPATGAAVNDTISALGTAAGAVGFLAGAVLLLPHYEQRTQAATLSRRSCRR
jgi:hypothetical protein